jgi:hypothetical protein
MIIVKAESFRSIPEKIQEPDDMIRCTIDMNTKEWISFKIWMKKSEEEEK